MEESVSYITCLLLVLIIIGGLLFQPGKKSKITKAFLGILYNVEGYILVNFASDLLENVVINGYTLFSLYLVNLLAFFSADAVIFSFIKYLYLFLQEKTKKQPKVLNIFFISTAIRMVTILILFFTKTLFVIEDGIYIEKQLSFIPYVMSSIIMAEFVVIVLINKKHFTKRQLFGLLAYQILPVFPIIIEMVTNIYSLSSIGMSLGIICMYVFVQATTLESSRLRETVLEEISSKDLLTGLNNRRQYYKKINEYKEVGPLGVMFLDINGLKYTNDHFGHAKGDELIQKFSKLLIDNVGIENIYRISGDEFVVVYPNISQEDFEKMAKKLHKEIEKNDEIAAMGYAYGCGGCLERIIFEAEERMYVDKNNSGLSRDTNIHRRKNK